MIAALVIFLIATFPATWLLMLFLGNVGLGLSYWGTLPPGIVVSSLLAGSTSRYAEAASTAVTEVGSAIGVPWTPVVRRHASYGDVLLDLTIDDAHGQLHLK